MHYSLTLSEWIKKLQEAEAAFGGHRRVKLNGHYGATTDVLYIEETQNDPEILWLFTDLATG